MLKHSVIAPALAGALLSIPTAHAQFATRVEAYNPGVGYAVEFGTNLPYTDSATALGAPSSVTPGEFGGPVTPFAAPYLKEQLVSLGVGGSITVEFADADWPNGLADSSGSIFSQNLGETRVYVGNDPGNLFLLNPSLAPVVDGMFPTDGNGNFHLPVNPTLDNAAFADQSLAGVRSLYGGSGGGTGFDLAWAVDGNNQSVTLDSIRFVRVDVLSGRSEIDAFSAVMVPEPSTIVLAGLGGVCLLFCRWKRLG
jgi:PEP-CTERM motif